MTYLNEIYSEKYRREMERHMYCSKTTSMAIANTAFKLPQVGIKREAETNAVLLLLKGDE